MSNTVGRFFCSLFAVVVFSTGLARAGKTVEKFFQFGAEVDVLEIDRNLEIFNSAELHKLINEDTRFAHKKLIVFRLPRTRIVQLEVRYGNVGEASGGKAAMVAQLFQKQFPEAEPVDDSAKKELHYKLSMEAAVFQGEPERKRGSGDFFSPIGEKKSKVTDEGLLEQRRLEFELLVDLLLITPGLIEGEEETYWTSVATLVTTREEQLKVIKSIRSFRFEWSESILDYFREESNEHVPTADDLETIRVLLKELHERSVISLGGGFNPTTQGREVTVKFVQFVPEIEFEEVDEKVSDFRCAATVRMLEKNPTLAPVNMSVFRLPRSAVVQITIVQDEQADAKAMAKAAVALFIEKNPNTRIVGGKAKTKLVRGLKRQVASYLGKAPEELDRVGVAVAIKELIQKVKETDDRSLRRRGFFLVLDLLFVTPGLADDQAVQLWKEAYGLALTGDDAGKVVMRLLQLPKRWIWDVVREQIWPNRNYSFDPYNQLRDWQELPTGFLRGQPKR